MTTEKLLQEAEALRDCVLEERRWLHRHPETGFDLTDTHTFVKQELADMGYQPADCGRAGIVALAGGKKPGNVFLLRADMDGLPIHEEADVEFAAQNGRMHACGHDLHTASLLGAARLLAAHREELCGTVKLFFQPDEEGDGGAQRMVDEGCLENPHVDAVFGGHNSTGTQAGQYGLKYGPCYAASNSFTVTVRGKGCHGAYPGSGIDPIAVAAQIVVALQTLTSRRVYATDNVVVTVGAFHAGTAGNIIPAEAQFKGIIRTFGPEMRRRMCEMFRTLVEGVAASMGAEAEVCLVESYPGVVNHEGMSALAEQAMVKLVGRDNVLIQREPNMGTEDFGAFMNQLTIPGCYCDFGFGDGQRECRFPAHGCRYRANEEGLAYAAALFVQVCLDFFGAGDAL